MLPLFRRYFELPPEHRALLREKRISAEHTPAEWFDLLRPLAAFERKANSFGGCLLTFLIILVIGTLFTLRPIPIALSLLSLGGYLTYASSSKKFTLPGNRLSQTLLPLLLVLREDMKPDAKLSFTLDIRGARHPDKKSTTQKLPVQAPITSITRTTYRDRWIEGQGALADGAQLAFTADELTRETKIRKRNSRGKWKAKTKFKRVTQLRIHLGLRADRHMLRPASQATPSRLPAPEITGKRL